MSDVKEYLLSASEMVGETYQLQTKTFSSIEFPLLIELFNKNQFKTVLDIGTGEGNWIKAFSSKIEHVDITAIDADSKLIETAKKITVPRTLTLDMQCSMKSIQHKSMTAF